MRKVYVAGPMTGIERWNFPAFERAAQSLRDAGYDVVSPHEFDLEEGFDPSSDGADFDLRAAMERDVEEVLDADGVALLDGWEESPGTVVEVLTAHSQGKPARPVAEYLERAVAMTLILAASVFGVSTVLSTFGQGEAVVSLTRAVAPAFAEPVEGFVRSVQVATGQEPTVVSGVVDNGLGRDYRSTNPERLAERAI